MNTLLKTSILIVLFHLISIKYYAQENRESFLLPDSSLIEVKVEQNTSQIEMLIKLIPINKEILNNQELMMNELYKNQVALNRKLDSLVIEIHNLKIQRDDN